MATPTYNFPPGSKDPFEQSFDGNYFVFAEKHSNLASGLQELNGRALEQHIPIGRTTIIFCHRLALVAQGAIRQDWVFTDHHNLKGDYYTGQYIVTSDQPVNGDPSYSSVWDNLYMATEEATRLSDRRADWSCPKFVGIFRT